MNTQFNDIELATYAGVKVYEKNNMLYQSKNDMAWIPKWDYNQLFYILNAMELDGYTYAIKQNIFELFCNNKSICIKQSTSLNAAIYNALVETLVTN